MNTLLKTASTSTILAIDLGKYKSVACLYDQDTRKILSLVMLYEIDQVPRERSRRRRRHPAGIELARFAWPARGRRGFWDAIFRNPWRLKERRRRAATRDGPIPYSCLAPPRSRRADDPTTNHPGAGAEDFPVCEEKTTARRMM